MSPVLDAGHKLLETHAAAAVSLMLDFVRRTPQGEALTQEATFCSTGHGIDEDNVSRHPDQPDVDVQQDLVCRRAGTGENLGRCRGTRIENER